MGRKKGWKLLAGLACGLILIISGFIMTARVITQYKNLAVAARDDQLLGLARSVDRSVSSYLRRYSDNLTNAVERWSFIVAERTYLETGMATELLAQMRDNSVVQDELITAMLLLNSEGELVISSDRRTDYYLPPLAGRSVGEHIVRPCMTGDGQVYLAFGVEREGGLTYYALMDLAEFYRQVAGDLIDGTEDRILLMDAAGKVLIHTTHSGVRVELLADMGPGSCDYYGLEHLLAAQESGVEQAVFYQAFTCRGDGPFTSRMAAVPAGVQSNGVLVVGASTNYDESMRPFSVAALRLISYGGMAIIGIMGLAMLTLLLLRRGEQTDRELAILREKNTAVEELNRKTQELAHHQRLQIIGTLTSSIAHEFNNLLTPIMGYSIMAMECLPEPEGELYDDLLEIYQASHKAKEIISRLSDLSRKNTPQAFRRVELDSLIRKVLDVAQPVRPVRVEVETALCCREVAVLGNETQLSQLVLNLVLNSYHAMAAEGGRLAVSARAEGGQIVLTVADTGPGIPEEHLPRIFDPFFSTKEAGKGTGLGLAIVRQVVEAHEGTISVVSRVGEGTAFTITLPAGGNVCSN